MWKKIIDFFSHHISHKELREKAKTLNSFCFIEIAVIVFFSYLAYDLLTWYKEIMTVEKFNGVAFWGAIGGIAAAIFSALKYINHTHDNK